MFPTITDIKKYVLQNNENWFSTDAIRYESVEIEYPFQSYPYEPIKTNFKVSFRTEGLPSWYDTTSATNTSITYLTATSLSATSTAASVNFSAYWSGGEWKPAEEVECADYRLRQIMRERCAPTFMRHHRFLDSLPDARELRARETLQRIVGDKQYRRFLKKGFITAQAKSGLVYQIFPGHEITRVYLHGQMVERLCVVLRGNFPATDSLIVRYLMILNNEDQFRSYAIKHGPLGRPSSVVAKQDTRSLPEIYKSLKRKVAA